jgi:Na+/H+ antiporter NhaC
LIKKIIIYLLLLTPSFIYSQKIDLPTFYLSDIKFKILIEGIDSNSVTHVVFKSDDNIIKYSFKPRHGKIDTSVSINTAGNYLVSVNQKMIGNKIRIVPGWLSVIPPLLAILLALIIKQVIISLAAGIFIGIIFIYDYNPFIAFLRFGDTFIINSVVDRDHMFIILFTLLIGGVVGIISKNGGTLGLANLITKLAKSSRGGMIASWALGVVIFFDDYANSLIIGNMMRPITDRHKISREKLAYIVDATAAPVASLFIISTWIGYQVGLIQDAVNLIGLKANAYDLFINSIPYGFYSIGTILFVFFISYSQRDFNSMLKAERRARLQGKVSAKEENDNEINSSNIFTKSTKPKWFNGAVPILVILFGTLIGLYFTGINSLKESGITDYSIQNIIGNSDSFSSLLWASLSACVVAVLMSIGQKILTLEESMEAWQKGVQTMLVAVIILVFAWGISNVTHEMKTADYIISVISESINPGFLPALIFIICAITAFATGTSWGIMAIVMPIAIPLTHNISLINHLNGDSYYQILYSVIAAVLSGSVFGDHCSPIADTTILSSLASKCNHIDHVNTQMPYALTVAFLALILGFIPAGFGVSPFISLILIVSVSASIIYFWGKKNYI